MAKASTRLTRLRLGTILLKYNHFNQFKNHKTPEEIPICRSFRFLEVLGVVLICIAVLLRLGGETETQTNPRQETVDVRPSASHDKRSLPPTLHDNDCHMNPMNLFINRSVFSFVCLLRLQPRDDVR